MKNESYKRKNLNFVFFTRQNSKGRIILVLYVDRIKVETLPKRVGTQKQSGCLEREILQLICEDFLSKDPRMSED